MGNCIVNQKLSFKKEEAAKYKRLVCEEQYYLLKLIYTDLKSRIPEKEVNLQNFLLFFEKNGYWGQRLFKEFDVGASKLITEEQFIKGIVMIFKTTEEQKIELLFKFFSGSADKKSGVGFTSFLRMLYNYPKEDLKKVLNNEEFFNKQLRKKLVANNNKFKGRRLDSINVNELSDLSSNGTTFRVEDSDPTADVLENEIEIQTMKQIQKGNMGKGTTFKVNVGKTNVQVATSNLHHLVKKFAISIFKQYSINIRTGKLEFHQFQDWMHKHKQLYHDYFKGFHSEVWQIDRKTRHPLFASWPRDFESTAIVYLMGDKSTNVFVCLIHSILLVFNQLNRSYPISVVCLDGLSAKKILHPTRGFGIQISHRDEVYETKSFYLQDQKTTDMWMEHLKFYQGSSIAMLYEMGQKIGVGKFSVVYKAKQNSTGQKFAVKVIETFKLEEQAKKMIAHESSIMSILSHPLLVTFKEKIQNKTSMYIVTELVEGKDMREFVNDVRVLSESEAAYVIKQIIIGVSYLHSLGIVHRDLKPENIMIEFNASTKQIGKIRIIDFGFANYVENIKCLHPSETIAGTPNYIAPEVLSLNPITQKSDNFSIGAILYFALSGNQAFGSRSMREILQNTVTGSYHLNDRKWKAISKEAKDLVRGLLDVNPMERIGLDEALKHAWLSKWSHNILQLETKGLEQNSQSNNQKIEQNLQ